MEARRQVGSGGSNWFSVRDYGAAGNGVHDDSDAIDEAVSVASKAQELLTCLEGC